MQATEKLYHDGLGALKNNNFKKAERLFRKFLKLEPSHFGGLNLIAIALMSMDEFAEAEKFVAKAAAMNQDSDVTYTNYGLILGKLNKLPQALEQFNKALKINSKAEETWNNRGIICCQLNQYEEAVSDFERATSLNPFYADAFFNKARALVELNRYPEALVAYQKAVEFRPDFVNAWLGCGSVFAILMQHENALSAHSKALTFNSELSEAWAGSGNALTGLRRHDEALAAFEKALAIEPNYMRALIGRGESLIRLGKVEQGKQDFDAALKLGADEGKITYTLAILGVIKNLPTIPPGEVAGLFDAHADQFDEQLVEKLKYDVPGKIFSLFRGYDQRKDLDILDLGCGTGLMGIQVKPIVKSLVGIDLAQRMLDRAKDRNLYDALVCADIGEFLAGNERKYDLVIAADVFVYIGDLTSIFDLAHQRLNNGVRFIFSIESGDEDYRLQENGRYQQSDDYIRRLSAQFGFTIEEIKKTIIREELDAGVPGSLAILSRSN